MPVAGDLNGRHDQLVQALAAVGDRRHHRARPARSESAVDIDVAALAAGDVENVQRHHQRITQLQELQHHIKIAGQVGGVHDHDHRVGIAVEHSLARHPLVLGDRAQGVGARQVDDADVACRRARWWRC